MKLSWWSERLAGAGDPVGVPLDHKRSVIYSAKRAALQVALPADAAGWLRSAGEAARAPHLVAAIAGVLHRYSSAPRVVVGVLDGDEALPVRVDLDPEMTFAALLQRVVEELAAAGAQRGFSRPALLEQLGRAGADNHNPLFAVALRISAAPPGGGVDHRHDVTVSAGSADGALALDYSARLIERATAERFARHVGGFLAAGLASPGSAIAALPYLGADERALLLSTFHATAVEFPHRLRAEDLVSQQAQLTPDGEALVWGDERVTYRELDRRSNRLARCLHGLGIRPGGRVGLCLAPGPSQLIGLLGIMKSGATVCPVDVTFPAARLRFTIEDSRLDLIVTDDRLRQRLPPTGTRTMSLGELAPVLEAQSDQAPELRGGPRDIAYILYTSGSTGRPKGVCMEHRALVNLVSWQRARSGEIGRLRTLQRTSIAFDVGFQEVLSTLAAGGSLVIADDELRADVSRLPGFIAESRIARAFLPPVALYQFAESAATQSHDLASLREVIVAGEQLTIPISVMRLFRTLGATLDNQYGPTESHVVTAHRLTGSSTRWPPVPPIGRPIDNARIYLLDRRRQPVPIGVVGEIFIGGVPVARGYLSDEQTAERFSPDPFTAEPDARMYQTGDMAAYLADGTIQFHGRRDRQVKVRGYRIELGEVEAALAQMKGVAESAVVAREDTPGERRLVAYIVPRDPSLPLSAVREFLAQRLPEHMVPAASAFVRLAAMPLTATGKIDHAALPAPSRERPELIDAYAPSRNDLEHKIAAIWSRALDVHQLGIHDEFFALGGHSLVAIKIASEINDLYGVELPLRTILGGTTVARVAAAVEALLAARAGRASAPPEPSEPLDRMVLPNGIEVVTPFRPETSYLYLDVFERQTYGHGIEYADGACIFDVGANIGLFTLYALSRAKGATVFAFEPAPPLIDALRQNTARLADRVRIFPVGLADSERQQTLTYYPTLTGMTSLYPDEQEERALLSAILGNLARDRKGELDELLASPDEFLRERLRQRSYSCRLRTLSEVIAETRVERIDLLKIDVQKAESDVLRGIRPDDWPRIRQVVVEVHDLNGRAAELSGVLRAQGFHVAARQDAIHEGSVVRFLYATR